MRQNNFECIAAYDINKTAVDVYNKNLKHVALERDLLLDFNEKALKPSVVISGAPCQGFSTAGKRDIDDTRNYLFLRAVEIALKLKPKIYVAENVAGILSGIHKEYFMDKAINTLCNSGYKTHLFKIDCRNLGMGQMRKRAILIAWKTDRELSFYEPCTPSASLKDVIGDIATDLSNHDTNSCAAKGRHKLIASAIHAGQKLSNVRGGGRSVHTWQIPHVFGKTTSRERIVLEALMSLRRKARKRDWGDADPVSKDTLEALVKFDTSSILSALIQKGFVRKKDDDYDLANTFNGKYRRLRWDEPSLTVDTRFGTPTLFLHPNEDRAFTVREAARLQGFPDNFEFSGSIQAQYSLVGNAVPPPLGKYISDLILNLL